MNLHNALEIKCIMFFFKVDFYAKKALLPAGKMFYLSFHVSWVCFSKEKNGLFIIWKMKVVLEDLTITLFCSFYMAIKITSNVFDVSVRTFSIFDTLGNIFLDECKLLCYVQKKIIWSACSNLLLYVSRYKLLW